MSGVLLPNRRQRGRPLFRGRPSDLVKKNKPPHGDRKSPGLSYFMTMTPRRSQGARLLADRRMLFRRTFIAVALAGIVLVAVSSFVGNVATLGLVSAFMSFAIYATVGAFILTRVLAFHPYSEFGWPNIVTLARTVLVALVAGYAAEISLWAVAPRDPLAWTFALFASLAVALDGLDGWLARRFGPRSAFGARFDMESDALLIMVLCALAVVLEKAGAWVLLIGAARYIFLAVSYFLRWMERPLPDSLRRKTVCAFQGIVLCALAMPPVAGPFASGLAAAVLLATVWSFAIDLVWLYRRRAAAMPANGDPAL